MYANVNGLTTQRGEIFSYEWDLSDYDKTRLNAEFVDFLKASESTYKHLYIGITLWLKRTNFTQTV